MSNETDLVKDLELGIEAEAFLNSPIGKYLAERSEAERDEAIEEFRQVDPTDAVKVRNIQNRIWRAESFATWLAQAIQNGRFAEFELKAND